MAAEDYFCGGHWPDDEYEEQWFGFHHRRRHVDPTCKRCGMRGLSWRMTDEGYRLFHAGTNQQHNCRVVKPASPDDFEDLTK